MLWAFVELDEPKPIIWSEKQIVDNYWDHWYEQMCKKFGKEVVNAKYSLQDCINDWIVVNWAWKVENAGEG